MHLGRFEIGTVDDIDGGMGEAVLSLIFAEGARPDADAINVISTAVRDGPNPTDLTFGISHRPDPGAGWLELLAQGMTFDCQGLAPADPARMPLTGALIGLGAQPAGEAIALSAGPHLASGKGLLPVVRVLAGLGARLAALPGVLAVVWQPARSWMAPDYFIKLMADWQGGGAFPALGLTSLQSKASGAMVSRGLDFLIGQELRIEAGHKLSQAEIARIAVRLIHDLVSDGPLVEANEFTGPGGERILAVPVRNALQVRVMAKP